MEKKYKGIVIGSDEVKDRLKKNLVSLVDINTNCRSYSDAYKAVKQETTDMIFVELPNDKHACFDFIRNVRKRYRSIMIFLIAKDRDADILLKGFRSGISDFIESSLLYKRDNLLSFLKDSLTRLKNIERKGQLISVFSIKGGQGVTTIAANLADHIYTLTGDNVVLLDLNVYMSDLSIFLDAACDYSPFDLIKDLPRMDEDLLLSSLTRHKRGFYFVSVPEEKVELEELRSKDVDAMLKVLKNYMDYIVVDLPHDFSETTISVIDNTDILLLVLQQSVPVIKSVQRVLLLLQEMGVNGKVRIVLNRYVESEGFSYKDITRILGHDISYLIRNDYKTVIGAINSGNVVNAIYPDRKVNKDIRRIAIDITGMPPVEEGGRLKAIMCKFFVKRRG